jgi:2-keto-4-pentenoate hydratase/2-oxohepta-3-ene-1,7-dioic acid hydratase in catechol pathway
MGLWLRFIHSGKTGFGLLEGETVNVHEGDMFGDARPTGASLPLADLAPLTPCEPSKVIALWNNSRILAAKQNLADPAEPLIFFKASNSYLASGRRIPAPISYEGAVFYEAELGVVIGKPCRDVSEQDAARHIFGYTCVNDVTALSLINKVPEFHQWSRAKSFDGFCPFGPVIATDLDVTDLAIRAELNGRPRQNYSTSDYFFPPAKLVSLISRDMTLNPGDVISCGTGPGALPLKAGSTIDIVIDGIGRLTNRYG